MNRSKVRDILENYTDQFNRPDFIEDDPISIPHMYKKKQDIEISGFFAATLSWGQRKTIIRKSKQLMQLMDNSPFEFVRNHKPRDRKHFDKFVHRTFQYTDTLYFLTFLQHHYLQSDSLEDLFICLDGSGPDLAGFHDRFFGLSDAPQRTRKHVPTPLRKSTCKRINMYLRWMVRVDNRGVDFGIWKNIRPESLLIPLDVHVDRIARKLDLMRRKQTDWLTTNEFTEQLRRFDPCDPVKYDFALFGLGVLHKDSFIS